MTKQKICIAVISGGNYNVSTFFFVMLASTPQTTCYTVLRTIEEGLSTNWL